MSNDTDRSYDERPVSLGASATETVAEIISKMRRASQFHAADQSDIAAIELARFADRLEAAAKRLVR
jgi:hypothetical protein